MRRLLLATLTVLGCASAGRAAVIADYNFISNPIPTAQPASVGATTVAPNVTTSAIKSGVGAGGAGAGAGGGTNGTGLNVDYTTTGYSGEFLRAVTQLGNGTQTNEAQAVSTAGYFNFILTPASGFAINLSDISITGARGGASTPRGFYLASSIENPNNAWGTAHIFGIGSEQSQRPTLTTYNAGNYTSFESGGANASSLGDGTLSLSNISKYQNVTSPIEFRFYVIGPANGNSIDFTDFAINGTVTPVSAPEPASLGLIGLGAVGLLVRRRRGR
jgi:PEP-CTERM motif-containing protein